MEASGGSVVGTWRLLSWETRESDGSVGYPLGPNAIRYLTYTVDGFMFAAIMAANRQPFAASGLFNGTPEELTAAGREYASYCGRYSLHDGTVVHHVEVSYLPNWIGADQTRFIKLDGDRLTITTGGSSTLTWERAS